MFCYPLQKKFLKPFLVDFTQVGALGFAKIPENIRSVLKSYRERFRKSTKLGAWYINDLALSRLRKWRKKF
jgi:hypothetical protein